jgi:hypothetical protein
MKAFLRPIVRAVVMGILTYSPVLMASSGGAPSQPNQKKMSEKAAIEKAQPAVEKLKKTLVARLQEAMKSGGAVKAIDVCNADASKIAGEISSDKVLVGRTAVKLRNPSNAPQEWMKPLLEYFSGKGKVGKAEAFKIVKLADNKYGYVEPLYMQPLCMTCHGTKLEPDVQAEVTKRYPADKAVGYQEGDFRGLVWSEVSL